MTIFTTDTLRKLWPHGNSTVPGLIEGIATAAPSVFTKYGFNPDGPEIAQAMAQFSHECGAGTEMTENIHYTAQRAAEVWPLRSSDTPEAAKRHFADASDCYRKCGSFSGDPDFPGKLIDLVYGTRMGNRPGTHDGRMFIGRGLAQTTGRDGYFDLANKTGLPLITHPEMVNLPENALECGVADFVLCGCLPFAKIDDTLNVTKRLNGGTIGLEERKQWLIKWKRALAAQVTVAPIQVPTPKPVLQPKHAAYGAGLIAAAYAVYHYFFN